MKGRDESAKDRSWWCWSAVMVPVAQVSLCAVWGRESGGERRGAALGGHGCRVNVQPGGRQLEHEYRSCHQRAGLMSQ